MSDKMNVDQMAKMQENADRIFELLHKEANPKNWGDGWQARENGKKRATNTLTLLIKMHALMDGAGAAIKTRSAKHQKELEEREKVDGVAYMEKKAAEIMAKVGKH